MFRYHFFHNRSSVTGQSSAVTPRVQTSTGTLNSIISPSPEKSPRSWYMIHLNTIIYSLHCHAIVWNQSMLRFYCFSNIIFSRYLNICCSIWILNLLVQSTGPRAMQSDRAAPQVCLLCCQTGRTVRSYAIIRFRCSNDILIHRYIQRLQRANAIPAHERIGASPPALNQLRFSSKSIFFRFSLWAFSSFQSS